MRLNYDDLEMAFEFVSFDTYEEHQAYICLETGKIYCESGDPDEELPPDLGEEGRYLRIPDRREFDLGKPLALSFAATYLPGDYESVTAYFRKSGAYSRFKALLEERGILEQWYEYEQMATRQALLAWCEENSIDAGR